MDGIHLLGEWYGCPTDTAEFTQAPALRDLCVRAAREAGLTVVGESFYQFEPQGVTGTVLLAESHIAIHTFPEHAAATFNLYCCRDRREWPWQERLTELLGATEVQVRRVTRGCRLGRAY